ncbi:MAG: alkaline phosphatase family protein, partial [Acetobacteraceae bacterium]
MTRRVVVVVLDGLRRDLLGPDLTPNLTAFREHAAAFPRFRSVFPSATRVVSATFATGCYPARHGLAGNSMALIEDGALVRHDAGQPDFLQHRRRVTGRALDMPTLAERLAEAGRAELFSNVSPGAAYAHDPDGFGHVHNRAGSFAPGRLPIDPLPVQLDIAGDRVKTERFVAEAVDGRRPAFAVLWLGEPDHSQHENPLGSPACRAAIAAADRRFAAVRAAVERRRRAGENVLLVAMSDHGHRTVTEVIDVDAELAGAGLKHRPEDTDLIAVSNGTASLVYLHPSRASEASRVADWLRTRPWVGEVLEGEALARVGQTSARGLACAVSMRSDDTPNLFGV